MIDLTQEEKELITVVLANSAHDPEQVDIHEDVTKLYHKVQPIWGTPECLDMEG
ncbi:hypothetical protein LCGC14_2018900 [marine sediment metagenome]|uniref:Uncharacterized protein n=1 Tax=marine sediment metagenome TaxID=412755 RepID=A0A0F9FKL3_9ZZZZ